MDPPTPDPATTAVCGRLDAALPDTVDGLSHRATTPSSAATTAWGDPPVVLRCGVPRPAGLGPTSELIVVNGVDWYPEQLTAGYRFTTSGRRAYIEVTVPDTYRPEVNALVDLAAAVSSTVPLRADGTP